MNPLLTALVAGTALHTSAICGPVPGTSQEIDLTHTSEPRGPKNDYRSWSYAPPLPGPASQAKRRRKARRVRGGR